MSIPPVRSPALQQPLKINSLPPEILLVIFKFIAYRNLQWALSVESPFAADSQPQHDHPPQPESHHDSAPSADPSAEFERRQIVETRDPSRDVRVVSHVCSLWRDIVLNSHYIWSRLLDCHTMPQAWFTEVYGRAGQVPLTVVFMNHRDKKFDDENCPRANTHLLLVSDRGTWIPFAELHLCLDGAFLEVGTMNSMLDSIWVLQPHLTRLTLDFVNFECYQLKDADADGSQPYDMSQVDAGLVFVPSTVPVRYTKRQPLFPNLIYLRLSNIPPGLSVLSVLSNTPCLQKLALDLQYPDDILPLDTTCPYGPDGMKVPLPHLMHIFLKGCAEPCLLFLESLDTEGARTSQLSLDILGCTLNVDALNTIRELTTDLLGYTVQSGDIPVENTLMFHLPLPSTQGGFRLEVIKPDGQASARPVFSLAVSKMDLQMTTDQDTDSLPSLMSAILGCCDVLYPTCTRLIIKLPDHFDFDDLTWFIAEIDLPFVLDLARANTRLSSLREVIFPCSATNIPRMFKDVHEYLDRRPSTGPPIEVINMYFVDANNSLSNAAREEFADGARAIKDMYGAAVEHGDLLEYVELD